MPQFLRDVSSSSVKLTSGCVFLRSCSLSRINSAYPETTLRHEV